MKKRAFIGCLLVVACIGFLLGKSVASAEESGNSVEFYRKLVDELDEVQIIDSSDLTLEMLNNRDGKIIIEECIGMVVSPEGDGKILNYENSDYYYISYASVENAKVGDVILTYFIYNPDNNVEDDILFRFDYIIDCTEEN